MFSSLLRARYITRIFTAVVVAVVFLALSSSAIARNLNTPDVGDSQNVVPHQLEGIGITEKLGSKVDMSLAFTNEAGERVTLGDYFRRGKPVMLSLAYYNCPSLCNYHLNGVSDSLRQMKLTPGNDFEYLVISIDPKETPALAAAKKENYIKAYGRMGAEKGWHFLVGEEASIHALADQVGFKFRWDEQSEQWAHSAAAIVMTPGAEISRYLPGVYFEPQTMRLSLVEAGQGKVGTLMDKLILNCFMFDPNASKYTLNAMYVMRAGAILIVLVLIAFLTPFWFRQRRLGASSSLQGEV